MATFKYLAKSADSRSITGKIAAENKNAVIGELLGIIIDNGLFIVRRFHLHHRAGLSVRALADIRGIQDFCARIGCNARGHAGRRVPARIDIDILAAHFGGAVATRGIVRLVRTPACGKRHAARDNA